MCSLGQVLIIDAWYLIYQSSRIILPIVNIFISVCNFCIIFNDNDYEFWVYTAFCTSDCNSYFALFQKKATEYSSTFCSSITIIWCLGFPCKFWGSSGLYGSFLCFDFVKLLRLEIWIVGRKGGKKGLQLANAHASYP